ncbi:MAG: hypothetical protein LBC20_14910 [Planctomycetaceae bacterium]|jgi:hypothetical protein|nr:hypothetical protein [Planctomycetaceae bacterium]
MEDLQNPIDYPKGLTFEKVWASIQELGKKYDAIFEREAQERQKIEEERQKLEEEHRKLEEKRQQAEEERLKAEEERRKAEEERRKEEYERRKEEEERRKEEDERRKAEDERRKLAAEEERKEAAERLKKLEAVVERTSRTVERTSRSIDDTNKKVGHLDLRFGELVEHLIAPGISDRFSELGYCFDEVTHPFGFKFKQDGIVVAQADILLENQDTIVVVEIKAKPDSNDVQNFTTKMFAIRGYFEQNPTQNKKILLGALAGAIFPKHVKQLAIKFGFFVITQRGDTVKIEVPKDFEPRKF